MRRTGNGVSGIFFFIFNSRPGRRAPRRSFHFISRFMAPQAENIEQWVTGDLQTNHNRRGIEAIYREISERNNLPARLINAVHLHFLDAQVENSTVVVLDGFLCTVMFFPCVVKELRLEYEGMFYFLNIKIRTLLLMFYIYLHL